MPNSNVDVADVFLVPNYSKMLKNCGDKKFSDYAKSEHTQLQFTFESVPVSVHFPTGVKVLYRAFSSDEVVILKEEQNPVFPDVKLSPYKMKVESFPKAKKVKSSSSTGSTEEIEVECPEGNCIVSQIVLNLSSI